MTHAQLCGDKSVHADAHLQVRFSTVSLVDALYKTLTLLN